MRALLLILAGLLAACSEGTAPATPPKRTNIAGSGYSAEVAEVELKDGTRCAVLLGPSRGGITCNWRTP